MMSRAQVLSLHASVLVLTVTGAVFAFMKYWLKSGDPFAVVNHPWQPAMLSAHVIAAPFALFAFGWIFGNHIWPAFTGRAPNRASGIASMLLIAPMTLTGYLLQVITDERIRHWMAVAHWVTSGLFAISYVAHLFFKPSDAKPSAPGHPTD